MLTIMLNAIFHVLMQQQTSKLCWQPPVEKQQILCCAPKNLGTWRETYRETMCLCLAQKNLATWWKPSRETTFSCVLWTVVGWCGTGAKMFECIFDGKKHAVIGGHAAFDSTKVTVLQSLDKYLIKKSRLPPTFHNRVSLISQDTRMIKYNGRYIMSFCGLLMQPNGLVWIFSLCLILYILSKRALRWSR